MSVKFLIPSPLQAYTQGAAEVLVESSDAEPVAALLNRLDAQCAGIGKRIRDDQGHLRRFVNIYVNDEDIRFLSGEETRVKPGDTVSIVPAIAGG